LRENQKEKPWNYQMEITIKISFLISILVICLSGCNNDLAQKEIDHNKYKQSLESANKIILANESEDIDSYIARHQWEMQKSGSGLRYLIYEKGKGKTLKKGDIVTLKYKVELINGINADEGIKEFEVGHGGIESGIEEAILLLKAGDKAKLILPPHLAYGLVGDENKIPPRATLIYDLEVISIK
jgi:FKBP-type peptidyl-prolyl cis-trans isomerase